MNLKTLSAIGLLVLGACARDPAATPSVQPTERVPIAEASLSANREDFAAGGECRRVLTQEYQPQGLTAIALLIPDGIRPMRRLLVVTDSSGTVRRYSDVRFSARTYVEIRLDASGHGLGQVGLGHGRGVVVDSAQKILDAANLGLPRALAADVLRRCARELGS